jgi:hypothetical protein
MITFAAVLIWIVLGALALFQGLLVLGAPLGRFAWGGQHRVLPVSLRMSSVVSIVIYALISAVVLARVDVVSLGVSTSLVGIAIWVVAAYFFVAIGLNLASKSEGDRSIMPAVSAASALLQATMPALAAPSSAQPVIAAKSRRCLRSLLRWVSVLKTPAARSGEQPGSGCPESARRCAVAAPGSAGPPLLRDRSYMNV